MTTLRANFQGYTEEFVQAAAASPFTVFLCGPGLNLKKPTPAATLRMAIKSALEADNFTVILGEDDSINNDTLKKIGVNLQDSELGFVVKYCNAIVVVADSVGSFCELGLFSWHMSHEQGLIKQKDFILLINKKFSKHNSYLNDGPAAAVNAIGRLDFVNFAKYDPANVVKRLKDRRGIVTNDRRGRPPGGGA